MRRTQKAGNAQLMTYPAVLADSLHQKKIADDKS